MSTQVSLPDYTHKQAKKEANERGESIGNVITEWMLIARYEERERE